MSFDPIHFQTFAEWLLPSRDSLGAIIYFIIVVPIVAFGAAIVAYLISAVRNGPVEGFYTMARTIGIGWNDMLLTSPRRTFAIARLAVQESLRHWVLVAFGVFMVVLLFAGWYLDVDNDNPAKLYLSVVLTVTTWLVLLLALFLSTFSLPNDIKNRTIYTVVTKPVRPGEIVLGRVLGFTAVGTGILVLMGAFSYVFVTRGLAHGHQLDSAALVEKAGADDRDILLTGETTRAAHHLHKVEIDKDTGLGQTDVTKRHWHQVERQADGSYQMGPPQGMLEARVPVFGTLRFLGRTGKDREKGYDVGKEWTYRSYIEGGTDARAIWSFNSLSAGRYPEGLPLELNLRVFRTHKGDMTRGILGRIRLHNPDPQKVMTSAPINFTAKEFENQSLLIPRDLQVLDASGTLRDVDLFDDLVYQGRLDISLECAERAQYFGMARGDVYMRSNDEYFAVNFFKCYVGIWLQMVLVICFGVMYSTFLNGPVSIMATGASILLGRYVSFVADLSTGTQVGGGPLESLLRIGRQYNVSLELDPSAGTNMMQIFDLVSVFVIRMFAMLMPDFTRMDTVKFVANGFNIGGGLLAQHITMTLAYAFVLTIIGYFFLKTREIAA